MTPRFAAGDAVQTPLGKGVVREARKNGRLLIDVSGRSVVLDADTVAPLDRRRKPADRARATAARTPSPYADGIPARPAAVEVDLHGLVVEEALARAEQAVSDALLADLSELRLIHGKSGGRIRASLHRRLQTIPAVRAFRVDPRNAGVTIVTL